MMCRNCHGVIKNVATGKGVDYRHKVVSGVMTSWLIAAPTCSRPEPIGFQKVRV